MERTKKPNSTTNSLPTSPKKSIWKCVGSPFRFNKRTIKTGELFEAHEWEIPKGFRDIIKQVDTGGQIPVPAPVKNITPPVMIRRKGAWYDVYDHNGKRANERGIKLADAKILLAKLTEIYENIKNKHTKSWKLSKGRGQDWTFI